MFGKLEISEMENILSEQIIGRIACHANNSTYIVPISYAYDGEFIYCHSYEGLKISMMRQNPDVCFEVESMENAGNWKSVIAWGKFEEVKDASERKIAIEKLYNRKVPAVASKTFCLSSQWPFLPDDFENVDGIIFRIRLEKKTGRFEMTDSESFAVHQ